ncbi:hypothetical protein F4801DRAFT_531242 [Xylaria longipes]|nr:hypothetical protein F4801DRAFT_531242 [Xylaria longipes]RYC54700.1 hypothetical protein CHU98_g11508 [Xylaria longipes]
MEEQPDVEILIHIGAPSRAVDDARYRSLAAAYLAFEPTDPIHFYPQSDSDRSIEDSTRVLATDEDASSNIPSDDRIGSFQSPQASFRSVVDNADSPQMRVRKVPDHPFLQQTPASATPASWETPPSIVQDSHPLNHAELFSLMSPTRVLENYLQHFEPSSGSSKQDSQSNGLEVAYGHASQNQGRRRSPRKLIPCTQQMIPCTPHIRNMTEPPSNGIEGSEFQNSSNPQQQSEASVVDESDDDIIEETKFLSSPQPSGLLRADSEPAPKLRRLDLVTSPLALARAASDIGPQSLHNHKAPVTIEFLNSHGFTYKSLEIRALEPPTSELHIEPQDLITEGLRKLGHDVGLPSRFRPKEQTREIGPYERGHWFLDCSSWEPRLKRDAWAFLANYIGTGTAGWGVWCIRDPDFRELRVYCWGSVVAHIYYVLWLSSQRKIVFTGSSWVDAEGAKVIIMGPRDCPQR